jgi:protease-4
MIKRLIKAITKKEVMPKETNEILAIAVQKHYRVAYFKAGLLSVLLLGGIISTFKSDSTNDSSFSIAQINISGSISAGRKTGDGSLLADNFIKATQDDSVKAIFISANSGGGSPTQAEILYEAIYQYTRAPLSEKDSAYLATNFSQYNPNKLVKNDSEEETESTTTRKPVIVVAQEICTSACYYMISPADLIISHKASLIGSIGVKVSQWQFADILSRINVGRVNLTTGKNKSILDPYITLTKESEGLIRELMLNPMFTAFKTAVEDARADKLIKGDDSLFSGLMWTGLIAKEKGLIDQVATVYQVTESMTEHYRADIKVINKEKFSIQNLMNASSIADFLNAVLYEMNNSTNNFN